MLNLTDYQITEEIYTNLKRIVYRGIRLKDQQPVILKCFGTTYPTPTEIARLQHEYEITKNLNLSGIIKPITLLTEARHPILIFEDMGGISLKQYLNDRSLELGEYLKIAIQLAQTLGELHQCRIIHKDIKPSNIIFNPDTFEVKLTDFAIASQLTRETPTISHPNLLEGSLAYISPEQTGRMNRVIDYRTDFYSLGVTLYEILTGQLPFISEDLIELVHSHIAKIPIPPHQINPQIPQVISGLIMKLLAKTAEERYQSGFGLKIDLENCLNQWQETGDILEFTLATQDFSEQLQIPQKLYGRERELAQLLVAFERVCFGTTELMLVAGYSGIGKSALVQEIHKPLVQYRGYFISGKFDQYKRNIPYSSLIQAFSDLMRQLLTESEPQIQSWKEKLLTALGSNGQVIIDVIPEVELIIGKQPPVPELGSTETQNRFNLFLKKFIHVFTQKEHPLVLFLDDLQWADLASLKLMQLLMTESESKYLLLIGAYRDNEVDATHPFMMTLDDLQKSGALVNQITLQPLKLPHINQLISETLNCSDARILEEVGHLNHPKKLNSLAELVLNKTNGNPFFLTQLLKSLHQEGLLNFDFSQGVWQWDIDRLKTVGITDNVVDLMISQIQKLSQQTQNILKLAACIGNQFNLEMLSIVYEKSISDTATELWEAVQAGLIICESNLGTIPVADNESLETLYQFLHDRVQQAAYSLIPDSQKQAVHLKIGQLLLKNTPPNEREEKIFEIVNQLNFSTSLITEQSQRDELAGLNLIAGKKAKLSAAYQPALNYLQTGIGLLATDSWQQQYHLTLSLYEEAAEVAYLNADFDLIERFAEAVLSRAKTVLNKVKVYEVKIQVYTAQGKFSEAINIGFEGLQLLGVKLPKQPNKFDVLWVLLRTKLTIGRKSIASLVDLPVMTAPYPQAAMRILSKTVAATYFAAPLLMPLIVFRQINLSLKWGNTSESAYAYSCYGLILCGVVGDIETGSQFGQLALNLVSRLNAREVKAKTEFVVHSLIKPWIEPVKETLNPLREAYTVALETGNLEFAAYSGSQYCNFTFLIGSELTQLESEMATYARVICQMGQERSVNLLEIFHQAVLNFLGEAKNPCFLIGKAFDEQVMLPELQRKNNCTGICYLYLSKLMLCFLFGEYILAVENASAAEEYLDSVAEIIITHFYFYDSLACLAVATDASPSERKTHLQKVLGNQKKMKKWARHAPMNFQHKYDLVEAEYHRVCGKHYQAIDYYYRAIEGAAKNGYIHEEALANELAAKFYLSLGKNKIAKTYMTEAYSGYMRWGAIAKVKDLESRYPELIPRELVTNSLQNEAITDSTLSRTTSNTDLLDLTTVVKASQAIASEIDLDNLLAKLMKIVLENAGAQSGILLLNREGQLFIEADGTIESDQILVRQSIPMEGSDRIPLSIINYVARTQEDIVLTDASKQGNFLNDPYIIANQNKSVLCTPIFSQGKLIGILYLENNLIAGTFTPERTQLLKLLCSQAAISLENAQLYEAQKEYTKTLERQVQERTQELQQQKALFDAFFSAANAGFNIIDTELRFVQVNEKIAEINGIPAADHIGKRFREVLPHIAPVVEPTYQQILSTGEPLLNVEVTGETASQPGVERHWLVSYFPLPGLDGKPIGAGTVVIEITDRKRTEAQLKEISERLSLALKSGGIGCWEWDIVQNTLIWDDRMYELYGVNKNFDNKLAYEIWASGIHPDDRQASETLVHQAALGKAEFDIEFRVVHPNRAIHFIKAFGLVRRDAQGIAQKMIGINFDISDRKRTEEALRQSEERWQLAIEGNKDGIWDFNPKTKELFMSPRCIEMLGFKDHEKAYYLDDWLQHIHPDDLSTVWDAVQNNMNGKTPYYTAEYRVPCEDGTYKWIQGRGKTVWDEQGQPLRMAGSVTDITDRKRAEEALRSSQHFIQRITDATPQIIYLFDLAQQRAVYINRQIQEVLGYTPEEFYEAGSQWMIDRIHPDDFYLIYSLPNRFVNLADHEVISSEYRLRHKNGEWRWMRNTEVVFTRDTDGKPIQILGSVQDITDRKQAEEALRQSKERWQLALNGANDGIWDWNIKTNEVFISPRYKQMLGYEDHEMANSYEEWEIRLHPEERDSIIEQFKKHLEGKTSFYTTEHRLRCKDGTYKWMLARGRALWGEDGKAIRVSGSVADITERKQAEQALQENEAFLRSIYDGVDQAIFVVDVNLDGEFRFVGWNRVGEAFVGVSSLTAIGKTPEEVFGAAVGATLRQHYTDCLMAGTAITYEENFVSNGEQNWSLTTLNPLRDAAGKIHRIIGTGTNISDRKRAEAALQESERVFRAIFNGAMDAMTIADDTAQYVDANPAACQLFGLSKEELLKTKISDFNEPGIDFAPIWKHFLEQGKFAGEYRLHRFDGTVRDVEFSASANFIPHRHLSVLRDVSDRKQAEAALQQAKEAADAASRAKGEFLSKMSHELRTPLNAILGFSQLLNRDTSLTSQQQEYLGIINRAGEHLLTLINDVLEMSKIEAGRIELRENTFNLFYLLNSLKEMFQLRAESKGLKLNFNQAPDIPQYVQTDESKLRQVLINLLGNAIKFTETGNILLKVTATEKADDQLSNLATTQSSSQLKITRLLFEIEDTGPGIAAAEIDTLFEAFVQTETGRKSESGTGLGLPISRQFVHLMGGEITVSSVLNQGTNFKFDIQVKLPEVIEVSPPKDTRKVIGLAPEQSSYRILVVEDQSDSRLLLVQLLSDIGFAVKEAKNGKVAVSLTQEWQPNLIWMDMQMPIMNGYEATRQIRATESLLSTTPSIIIALTANAFAEDKAAVLSAGCNDFVSKPFRGEVIFDKIAEYLGVRYIYETKTLPKLEQLGETSLEPELFQGVSPEWIAQLYQAALELEDRRIKQLNEQIIHSHPLLASTLETCTKKLRFDIILEVIKKIENT